MVPNLRARDTVAGEQSADLIGSREDMQAQIAQLKAELDSVRQQLQHADDKLWEAKKDVQVCGCFKCAATQSVFESFVLSLLASLTNGSGLLCTLDCESCSGKHTVEMSCSTSPCHDISAIRC